MKFIITGDSPVAIEELGNYIGNSGFVYVPDWTFYELFKAYYNKNNNEGMSLDINQYIIEKDLADITNPINIDLYNKYITLELHNISLNVDYLEVHKHIYNLIKVTYTSNSESEVELYENVRMSDIVIYVYTLSLFLYIFKSYLSTEEISRIKSKISSRFTNKYINLTRLLLNFKLINIYTKINDKIRIINDSRMLPDNLFDNIDNILILPATNYMLAKINKYLQIFIHEGMLP